MFTQEMQAWKKNYSLFFSFYFTVLPEYPVVLNRWGRQLNGTTLGPKEEVDNCIIETNYRPSSSCKHNFPSSFSSPLCLYRVMTFY